MKHFPLNTAGKRADLAAAPLNPIPVVPLLGFLALVLLTLEPGSSQADAPVDELVLRRIEAQVAASLPAFPGAQGGGAESVDGRGGTLFEVTTLEDYGHLEPVVPGSLRQGVEAIGARVIVFRVSGTIELKKPLTVYNSNLTIAGQTAPRGGITLSGRSSLGSAFAVKANDVIVRYIRFRKGTEPAVEEQDGDSAAVSRGFNVILDHCSISWSIDENAPVACSTSDRDSGLDPPHNVTLSWSLIAEPLGYREHPTNAMISAGDSSLAERMSDVDFHHCLLANSSHRNPLIRNKSSRFVSNIVYNWDRYATQIVGGAQVDIIGNLYKPGPLYHAGAFDNDGSHEVQVCPFPSGGIELWAPTGSPYLYMSGNIGPHNGDPDSDNWVMAQEITNENGDEKGPLSAHYRRLVPLRDLAVPIVPDSVYRLERLLLPSVGASQRVDCLGRWVPDRDAVDARIIDEYRTYHGIIPLTEGNYSGTRSCPQLHLDYKMLWLLSDFAKVFRRYF